MKKWFINNILIPLSKKYHVGIFGPYWTLKDNVYRALVKSCKVINFEPGVTFLNKLRIQIPPDEENLLYSSAKICLNFHEREKDGSQPHYIVNQRTFKIPACGGFELCDHTKALRKYFKSDEIITASPTNPDERFELIDFYLKNDDQREMIKQNGIKHSREHHTYHNRVNELLNLYDRIDITSKM